MIILKMSEVKYKTKHGEGPQLLSPKQILRILPAALSQVKFKANFYSLYRTKWVTQKVYHNNIGIINSIEL